MASLANTESYDVSIKKRAWVEAQSVLMATDVLNQFLRAESEAARDLGYQAWEEWENDKRVFELARSRF